MYCKTIYIKPVAKPRMTRRDKWEPRENVKRYYAFCNELRLKAGSIPENIHCLECKIYLPFPKSYSKKKIEQLQGTKHLLKPDLSNIIKGIEDALFKNDQGICDHKTCKRWDDGNGPRIELKIS